MPKSKEEDSTVMAAGKENISIMNESISPEESSYRMITMENFLRDFDIQVKERVKHMEMAMKKALAELTRLGNSEKLKISKEIRTMTVKEFIERGGDVDTLEFKELTMINSTMDVSFQSRNSLSNCAPAVVEDGPGNTSKIIVKGKGKREAPPLQETSLLRDTLKRNTRSRVAAKKNDTTTPHIRSTKTRRLAGKKEMPTPMITPKFDPTKPLTAAREPHLGETLVSFAGSPVVSSRKDPSDSENSDLVSISMSTDQAVLGGRLFVDDAMSPNTLMLQKQVIEEAMCAINSRLEALNSQIGSRLDIS